MGSRKSSSANGRLVKFTGEIPAFVIFKKLLKAFDVSHAVLEVMDRL